MYMHRHKCIFIHIPKSAGTSVLKTLGHKGGRDHVEWRHYAGANERWFRHYHKFAILRDPLDRARSAYNYLLKGGNQSEGDLALKRHIDKHSSSFDEFVQNVMTPGFIQENVLFKPQYLFVCNRDGIPVTDTLLRFDSLEQDWRALSARLDLPALLTKQNAGSTAAVQSAQDRTVQRIRDLYPQDYALLSAPEISR